MRRNYFLVALVLFIFFVISFLTNILGPLIPEIINDFSVSLAMAALLPFSFFIAYGVFSIPSGMIVEKYKEKKVMIFAFFISSMGALFFSLFPVFHIALVSLFMIGTGMAMLQVAINPLLRVAGGEEHFAFNSVMGQLVFGLGSFLSPFVFKYLVTNLDSFSIEKSDVLIRFFKGIVPETLPWVSLYWIFAIVSLCMVVLIFFSKLPKVELKEDEKAGAWSVHKELFKDKKVIMFFIGIFAYVGTEQGIANWMSQFLSQYHGYSPRIEGAGAVSSFWGLMTVGCILGLLMLKFIDSKLVLRVFTVSAIVSLTLALFGGPKISLFAFPATGFFASVMWSVIMSLALNSVDKHHGSFSGILVSGIMGGAIVPLIIGSLADLFGLRFGMTFLYITLAYVLSISFWANPLIKNKIISLGEKGNKN